MKSLPVGIALRSLSFSLSKASHFATKTNPSNGHTTKRIFFKDYFFNELNSAPTVIDSPEISEYRIPTSEVNPFSFVGSCSGLLCLRKEKKQPQDFCIINPTTEKYVFLPALLSNTLTQIKDDKNDSSSVFWTGYGFGYYCVHDDYKVVRIAQKKLNGAGADHKNMGWLESEMAICCVKSGSCKIVKMPYFTLVNLLGVFVNGILHWQMGKYDNFDQRKMKENRLIVGYDLATDEFRELPLPDFETKGKFSIGVLGEWLCLSANYGDKGIDFWVMKEYGVKESWTKLFSIQLDKFEHISFFKPLSLSETGDQVLMELEKRGLMWYQIDEKKMRMLSWKSSTEAVVCESSNAPLPSNGIRKMEEKNLYSEDPKMKKDQKASRYSYVPVHEMK